MTEITLEEIIARLNAFSDRELERLAHEIRVILDARDEYYEASLQKRQRRTREPMTELVKEAQGWLEFAKRNKVSPDMAYWVNKVLIARDKQREIERQAEAEECVEEMVCQRCGHELDCFCGCTCLCHEMV